MNDRLYISVCCGLLLCCLLISLSEGVPAGNVKQMLVPPVPQRDVLNVDSNPVLQSIWDVPLFCEKGFSPRGNPPRCRKSA
ncbi:uncharacterized protein LOC132789941 [Drosophila nasuta]|uniref:uncharacterized protein LOC132789941 n=1 Tax=Drosophila nasuta TaxID=42062 RepID=UPI00295F56F2|nr:uncharacterized protein LOC132789941 [Drosophila nasuta]